MDESKGIEYHIPRSDSPQEVLSALASSITLRDLLNSMEATAGLLLMMNEFDDVRRQKFLEEDSKRLKRQISTIRLMFQEIRAYLKELEAADKSANKE